MEILSNIYVKLKSVAIISGAKTEKKIEKEVKMSRLNCFLDHTKHFQSAFKKTN